MENETTPFLQKTYEMVDDPATDAIVSWTANGSSFVVWDLPFFGRDLLPKFFKHNNFSSFVRQLNTYGFRKVSERWEFANHAFLRGHKHLLNTIHRRKPVHSHPQQSCVEVAHSGLEQQLDSLQRDKNLLMQQLVRLRHQQQATDNQLQGVGDRVQLMEQRQQQMMSFLAKAIHTPALLAHLVSNQNDATTRISGLSKKRRLPTHDQDNSGMPSLCAVFSEGQVVKYQPLINDAAMSMLHQILKLNAPLSDQSPRDPNAFLIDHLPGASGVADTPTSSVHDSQVTLSEVTHNSKQPGFTAETGLSVYRESTVNAKTCSSSSEGSNLANQDMDMCDAPGAAILSDFDNFPGIHPESSLELPDLSSPVTPISVLSFLDSLSTVQTGTLALETDVFPPGTEVDGILPGSNDAFWEQFFPVSSLSDPAEDVDSSKTEGSIAKEHELGQDEEWEKPRHHMSHLTEKMGLLSAESGKV